VEGLDVHVNYAYNDTSPVGSQDLGGREEDQRTSKHKVNLGLQYRSSFGLDLSSDLHLVSDQIWVEQVTDTNTGVRFEAFGLPGYTLLNARIGYRLAQDSIELGLVGTSLLGGRHREHPYGQRLGTRLWATIAARL
jgi:iron complex outermembrane receptor protein